jgi:hypothetical protein
VEVVQTNPYDGSFQAPGIDLNCNGDISDADGDLIWHELPAGDLRKDIYVQVNFMGNAEGTGRVQDPVLGVIPEPYDHAPPSHPTTGVSALTEVKNAFARQSITLHIDIPSSGIPHHRLVYLPGFAEVNQLCEDAIDPITGEPAGNYFDVMDSYIDPRAGVPVTTSCSLDTTRALRAPSPSFRWLPRVRAPRRSAETT